MAKRRPAGRFFVQVGIMEELIPGRGCTVVPLRCRAIGVERRDVFVPVFNEDVIAIDGKTERPVRGGKIR